mgnify:CR=1 FL=1
MLALGRRAEWSTFDEHYARWVLKDETSPECYAQISKISRLAPGEALDAQTRTAVRDLLMRPVALNRACADLFERHGGHPAAAGRSSSMMRPRKAHDPIHTAFARRS